jgi:antitoxin HicB
MDDYAIVIIPLDADDGGGFLGLVPDLPGCMSDGETQAEALENTRDAIEEWLELQARRGIDIPAPGTTSDQATQREERLLDVIRSLAEYREQVDEENKDLKRKLAELIAVLKDNRSTSLPRIDVSRALSRSKPPRTH